MSSHKPFCLALCLVCAALPARAEKPNDNRPANNDNRAGGALERTDSGYTKEWGGKNIREWISDLHHSDPTNRVEAMLAIVNFKQAADAVPAILKQLHSDGDASVRVKAAIILRMIRRPHETDRTRIISGLAHALHYDPQSIVRYEAASSLQSFLPLHFDVKEERDVLQDLVAGTSQKTTYELREVCIMALILAGVDPEKGPDPRVTDALMTLANPIKEPAMRVRVKAIMALGAKGRPHDAKKFNSVMDVLKMPGNYSKRAHPIVRIWSHVAVIALQTEQKDNKKELDAIAEYLTHREALIRREAVQALGALEEKSQAYVDEILNLLKREDNRFVKAEAAEALGRIKNSGSRVIAALIRLTEDDKPESFFLVWKACRAFALLGVTSGEVMNALYKVLDHKSLTEHQRMVIKIGIEEMQNPRKKPPVKDANKKPDKGNPPRQNKNR